MLCCFAGQTFLKPSSFSESQDCAETQVDQQFETLDYDAAGFFPRFLVLLSNIVYVLYMSKL
jgi:predicted nucleic-acid-binding protein